MAEKELILEQDEELYRELSIPFKTPDEANEALTAFMKELQDIRTKYRIRDILFAIQVPVKYDDGEEGSPIAHGMLGDCDKAEALAAWLLGRTGAERQERIATMTERAIRAVKSLKAGRTHRD